MTTYECVGQTYGANGYEDKAYTVDGPLYHGSRSRWLQEGDQLRAGFKTNPWGDEGPKSQFVHFTTNRDVAVEYARQAGGYAYEVEPTGDFRMGYNGDEYKTVHPLTVIRRIDEQEAGKA